VERPIGTMRREFLDRVLFWNGLDMERKLTGFQLYDKRGALPCVVGWSHAADLCG